MQQVRWISDIHRRRYKRAKIQECSHFSPVSWSTSGSIKHSKSNLNMPRTILYMSLSGSISFRGSYARLNWAILLYCNKRVKGEGERERERGGGVRERKRALKGGEMLGVGGWGCTILEELHCFYSSLDVLLGLFWSGGRSATKDGSDSNNCCLKIYLYLSTSFTIPWKFLSILMRCAWIDSAPCSPMSPNPRCDCENQGTTWSSKMCILGKIVAWVKEAL